MGIRGKAFSTRPPSFKARGGSVQTKSSVNAMPEYTRRIASLTDSAGVSRAFEPDEVGEELRRIVCDGIARISAG